MKYRNHCWAVIVFMMVVTTAFCFYGCKENATCAYETIVSSGYKGSEEQFIASLVGETYDHDANGVSAYEKAAELGYTKDFEEWSETLTGYRESDSSKTVFQIAKEVGYTGGFSEFLEGLVRDSSQLGRSHSSNNPTEYEKAVNNGYVGSYIEWLIFLVK